ncbi:class I SAM-dependent methyltransferase [Mesorhizobium sp. WSM3224]|uniref:class I SAM-dependent methyltransferase n=1 Tax=Mesorhizobium sp. WSM3224 TaxID=1040986 RepID=UPI000418B8A8|nr:class I SAM-dependent methyltransferase [Mesorhizobium sp. WSM3224]
MSQLKQRIISLIGATGPIPVSEYMALCLFDPDDGYYMTREPFGAAGDFITAPEISQMFGELVGVWLYQAWQGAGRPLPATFAEIGPGRGTLMKDVLRTWSRLDPALSGDAWFALIETSPRLVEIQRETLAGQDAELAWHLTIDTLPRQPLFIVGNELFDAVPIRQFVHIGESWRERMVGLDDNDELRFFAGAGSLDPTLLPDNASDAPEGAIAEVAPARAALMAAIAERIAMQGGAGLFIDYGHLQPGIGDTLQALRRHEHEDVLANPGEADITSHVDFAALAAAARSVGLGVETSTQGEFLLGMGLLERAGTLGADADAETRQAISDAVERLAGPDAMGELFKVMKVLPAQAAA